MTEEEMIRDLVFKYAQTMIYRPMILRDGELVEMPLPEEAHATMKVLMGRLEKLEGQP